MVKLLMQKVIYLMYFLFSLYLSYEENVFIYNNDPGSGEMLRYIKAHHNIYNNLHQENNSVKHSSGKYTKGK